MKPYDFLDRPIAFHRCFVTITGSVNAALLLSQAVYWAKRTTRDDGWFFKTADEWNEETGLSRNELEEARKRLRSYGYLEEKKQGAPAKLFYRVNEDAINQALQGNIKQLTLSDVIENFGKTLINLSRAGLMRAKKLGIEAEFVDYQEVLEMHGLTCHLCSEAISFGPGQKPGDLAFDHVLPLVAGGVHVFANIKPSHVACNARKGGSDSSITQSGQGCLHKENKNVYSKQTEKPTVNKQVSLRKANNIGTETTSETTSETTAEKNPADSLQNRLDEIEIRVVKACGITHRGNGIERRLLEAVGQINQTGATIPEIEEFLSTRQKSQPVNFIGQNFMQWRSDKQRSQQKKQEPRPFVC